MPEPARTTEFRSYSASEVAAYLGVTRQTVHRWVAIGRLSGFNIGGPGRARIRITSDVLDAFIAGRALVAGDLSAGEPWVGVR